MTVRIINGDCRDALASMVAGSVHCCVTSPPYWGLRDYGVEGQLGLEPTYHLYIERMVKVFREVRRVLRDDGTLWLNLGDSYANDGKWGGETGGKQAYLSDIDRKRCGREKRVTGLKPKDLIGIPWRVAFALQADGWWLRQDIIWHKPNPMPESVKDRCTKAHEYLFLLTKSARYYFDVDAIKEPAIYAPSATMEIERSRGYYGGKWSRPIAGRHDSSFKAIRDTRNKRSVWTIATKPYRGAHFATFPPALVEPCIMAGCPQDGTVLDPFGGSGTVGMVADSLKRNAVLIELNPEYIKLIPDRVSAKR
jgi:DNA modification methylase